jgi:hypothetical protein
MTFYPVDVLSPPIRLKANEQTTTRLLSNTIYTADRKTLRMWM